MATFRAAFAVVSIRATTGATMPVMKGRGANGLKPLTTSAASQTVSDDDPSVSPTVISEWSAPTDGFLTVRCDGAVWVSVGASPTAAVGADIYLAADERFYIAVESGDKIAVIDG